MTRRRSTWLVGGAAVVVLVVLGRLAAIGTNDTASVVDMGPAPSSITEIAIGHSSGVRGLAVTDDAVWVTSTFDSELLRVDPATNTIVDTFPIPDHVEGVTAVGSSVWLSRYEPNEVVRLDPVTGALTHRLAFGSQPSLATDGTQLWVIAERGGESLVVEVDPNTAAELAEIPLGAPAGFATVDGDNLWVANHGVTTVTIVDLTEGHVAARLDVGGEPRVVVAAGGSIWVSVNKVGPERTGSIVRIDTSAEEVTASVATGRWIHSLAGDDDTVWATNFDDGTVSVIDVRSSKMIATTPVGNRPGGVAMGHGSVWITPHRRNVLLRIDPTMPVEAAAVPDLARTVAVANGTAYIRCSGSGSPTVLLTGNQTEGLPWPVVEARLSRSTRVCAYEPVGIADPAEAGNGGPAGTVADDLAAALDSVGEMGPFVVIGEFASLDAQMFASTQRAEVVGLVLVNGFSPDYFDRVRALLPSVLLNRMDQERGVPSMRWFDESLAQVKAIGGFGDLPLVVLSDAAPDAASAESNDPLMTVAEARAVGQLLEITRREQAALSTQGRLVVTTGLVTPDDVVDATMSLLR